MYNEEKITQKEYDEIVKKAKIAIYKKELYKQALNEEEKMSIEYKGNIEEDINNLLRKFKVEADVEKVERNRLATIVELKLEPGVKLSKLKGISTEIALFLRVNSPPLIRPITQRGIVSLEFLNNNETIMFDEHVESLYQEDMNVPLAMGIGRDGREFIVDLQKIPHLLIAGATNSGKSICLHTIINSIIEKGCGTIIYLVDPKKVEFIYYKKVKCIKKIVYNPKGMGKVLEELSKEMYKRFKRLKKKRVTNIVEYNNKCSKNRMNYIVLIADELASVVNKEYKENQTLLENLAAMSRAVGIHIVVAIQRPSVMDSGIRGVLKANFSGRLAFRTSSKQDSRVILDCNGAEKLQGKGDGLLVSSQHDLFRFKGYFLNRESIEKRCKRFERGWFK